MLTIVAGNGANCTLVGTTTPTPMLKLTLETLGALPLLITVCRISVLCCCVRLTTGAVAELVEEEVPGAAFCEEPLAAPVPGWFARPGWPLADAGWSVVFEGAFAPVVERPVVLGRFASPVAEGEAAPGAVCWFEVAAGALLGALPWVVPGALPVGPWTVWPFASTAENSSAETATAVFAITRAVMALPQVNKSVSGERCLVLQCSGR